MPIDPSIPLQFKGVDVGELIARQQNAELRRMQIENERMKIAEGRAEKEAYGQIFGGTADGSLGGAMSRPSQQSMGALASVNPEAAMKVQQYFSTLDEQGRKREEAKWKAAAPLLIRMKQMPYAQRRAFLQSATPVLMGSGWSSQELSSFDPTDQNVDAISAAAMTVNEVVDSQKIDWHPIGENGSFATDQMGNPTGSGNPFAPQSQGSPAPQSGTASGNPTANNNPGALRRPGSTLFQHFSTPEAGIAAQNVQLNRYFKRGLNNVSSIVETYAPRKSRGGDNTDEQVNNYIGYVSRQLGVNPKDTITPSMIPRLGQAMREFETGHRASSNAPRRVMSRQAFNELPSGTHFIAPDGSERVKP